MKQHKEIDVARDFTDIPGGRLRKYSTWSGEEFREDVLIPALAEAQVVTINLDGLIGMPASWCEEVFGGVVRALPGITRERLEFKGVRARRYEEAIDFFNDAKGREKGEAP